MLVVYINHLLHFISRTQEDSTLVMDMLGHNIEDPLTSRVDSEATGILEDHGHGGTLVQDTKLALGALLISRVGKNTAIEQGSIGIGDHAADVTGAVWLAALAGILDGLEVLVDPVLPVDAVSFVDGVDRPLCRQGHVGVGQDELAERILEGETINGAAAHGDDKLRRCTVHGETRRDELPAGQQDIIGRHGLAHHALGQLEDAEDGADRHAGVEVRRAVNRIAHDGISRVLVLSEDNGIFLFFRDHQTGLAGAAHGRDEDIVANHIQLLLIITGYVRRAGQTLKVDQRGSSDVVGDRLEGELKSMAEEAGLSLANDSMHNAAVRHSRKVTGSLWVFPLLFRQESSQGNDISVDILLTNPVPVGSHDDDGRFEGLMCSWGVSKQNNLYRVRTLDSTGEMRGSKGFES